jgi:hypothetical protein
MINIKNLWEAMPRELQRKSSLHNLKQTVDTYNATHGWQPIETAPREGDVFLAFVPHGQVGFAFAACQNMAERLVCMMSGDDFTGKATHWMPLPEFPEMGAELALASESQREAAGLADEKSDGQAENVELSRGDSGQTTPNP